MAARNSLGLEEKAASDSDASVTQKMISATVGSLLTSVLVTPLDVVRVRLQSQQPHGSPSISPRTRITPTPLSITNFTNLPSNIGISACCREVFWINNNAQFCVAGPTITPTTPNIHCAAEETQRKSFNSTLDGLRKIARHEGPSTLWRGLSPTLVMAIPANVIYFTGYDWLRHSPSTPLRGWISDSYVPLAAGSSARILAAVAVSPIEMFRTRMQASQNASTAAGNFRNTLQGVQEMVKAQGFRSLWRGLTLTLWRDVPFSAIYWWGYEGGRNFLTDIRGQAAARNEGFDIDSESVNQRAWRRTQSRSAQDHTSTLVDSFLAGAGSGAVAAFVTTPFDVGKTRKQVMQYSNANAGSLATDTGAAEAQPMLRFLAQIFREQGVSGLFRGWAARCLKVAPACAIMISSYEIGKKMARDIHQDVAATR